MSSIKNIIEKTFNSNSACIEIPDSFDAENMLSEIEYGAGVRLLNAWCLYKKDEKFQYDLEICLRDYLLTIKDVLDTGPNYKLSDFAKLQLHINRFDDTKVFVDKCFPETINNQFVNDCFSGKSQIHNFDGCCLKTTKDVERLTGFKQYKSMEQKIAVHAALNTPQGYTTLVSMPTGGGKSLITQTVAFKEDGLTLVIVPTISLMIDQTKNARSIIKCASEDEIVFYHSKCNCSKIADGIINHKIKLIFISPEAIIRNPLIRDSISKANNTHYLKNIVFDEAHIIVEWGASFRIDFQCLDAYRKTLIKSNPDLRTFLLSATFSKSTVEVLKQIFSEGDKWIEVRCDSLRREPRYSFCKANNYADKLSKTIEYILTLPHPMIVYVRSPKEARELVKQLNEIGVNNAQVFSGKTEDSKREELIKSWSENKFSIMIATCAFGVGVDKKDVRTVLHLYVPDNPNAYYQEAGRGGRDGFPCLSVILYIEQDLDTAFGFTQKVITTEKFYNRWFGMIHRLGNGKVTADTSIIPRYRKSNDEYFDFINDKDIMWNAYVVLLLKRHGCITIDDFEFINEKYIFTLSVLNKKILYKDSAIEVMENIRQQEWAIAEKDYNLMISLLRNSNVSCVCDAFCRTYDLADEYCSGCNSHAYIKNACNEPFIFKKNIKIQSLDLVTNSCFPKKTNIIVFYDEIKNVLELLNDQIDSLVIESPFPSIVNTLTLNVYGLIEFLKLHDSFPAFFGDRIAIIVKKESQFIEQIFDVGKKEVNKGKTIIYLVEEDFDLKNGKKISENIEGIYYQEYQLEGLIKNV